jgi:hypothetical protein
MIMRGKVTVATKHWHGAQARLMVAMLAAGVALRAGLDGARRAVRRGGEPSDWAGAWRRRAEWLSGYPVTGAEVASAGELARLANPNSRSYTPT